MSIKYIVIESFCVFCCDRSINLAEQKHKNIIFT